MHYVDMGTLSSYRVGSPHYDLRPALLAERERVTALLADEQLELFDKDDYLEEVAHTGFVRFKGCT